MEAKMISTPKSNISSSLLVLLLLFLQLLSPFAHTLQTYIVHVSPPRTSVASLDDWHASFLPSVDPGEERLVHSYGHVFSGFAARLTEEEVEVMRGMDGFVHAQPDEILKLDTTYSPSFLGLHRGESHGFWNLSSYGEGVIIGMVDSGISPDHLSFDDEGMPPPPPGWKGACEFNASFRCNNKIIGARVFDKGWMATIRRGVNASMPSSTPLDDDGHGSHTAGIAAGRFVENANVLGQANGTAAGMAPRAHLAVYKVCTLEDCILSDVIAGIESAVKDGVDVLSLSIGGRSRPIYKDSIAIATFGAVAKGIFVSCSAGNTGPRSFSTHNEAPWLLTVGASTMNRSIRATVKLGNGEEFDGESIYQPANFSSELLPLIYPLYTNSSSFSSSSCYNGSLDAIDVKGKIVLCDADGSSGLTKGKVVREAGGAAMILSTRYETDAESYAIPASAVVYGNNITNYIRFNSTPTSTILFKGTVFDGAAPSLASYSSRGPSTASPGVLKPDIIGPGHNILSAWPDRSAPFNILSGTSMATPHLSGVAALLKSTHRNWSPAMIKSAIMTTADITDSAGRRIVDNYSNEPATFSQIGAGLVVPTRANDPGLVYDLRVEDYIGYLCGLDLTDKNVGAIARRAVNCSNTTRIDGTQLNYPSIYVELGTYRSVETTVERTVTNVGPALSNYTVTVVPPPSVTVVVRPRELMFSKVGEEKKFTVHLVFNGAEESSSDESDGTLTWVSADGKHSVRSVISVQIIRNAYV